jgi:hypothetical protein
MAPANHGLLLDRILAFAFGVTFVSVLLYLGAVQTNPTPLAIRIDVTVLALAAAGVGAMLPGFLQVRYKNFVRAGGALALFALVYLSEPSIGKTVAHIVEPSSPVQPIVDGFLTAIDSGDPSQSWKLLSATGRQQLTAQEVTWNELYRNNVAPLGAIESRVLVGETQAESPPGAPPGLYRALTYKSKHVNQAGYMRESVIVRANSSQAWEVYTYQLDPA